MSWQSHYKARLVNAQRAAERIEPGSRVVFGHAVGEPALLADALVSRRESLRDVEIVHMISLGKAEYCRPGMEAHFRHNSLFLGPATRDAVAAGRGDFTPCYFSEIPKLFRDGYLPVDVACVQVSPPDESGYCSLGVSVDYAKAAIESAKIVIAEVNRRMPRTMGDSFVHTGEIDYFVAADYPLPELPAPELTDVERQIGAHCASLIENGSTLQLGIGSLPNAVLASLQGKKDLGIHSEMVSDGIIDLMKSGVINNRRKTVHKGYCVVTFLMGTQRLYDFADRNMQIQMHPVDYVNDPNVIAQNDKMVSINSCVQIDLGGQAASESVGLRQISAVGGQVDFVRGANLSAGGKSILAIPSTAGGGKISKIVPVLSEGAAVTTSRNDINFVVTEYGVAQMKGKTLRQRAKALIEIAHPDFRGGLVAEWEKRFCTSYQ